MPNLTVAVCTRNRADKLDTTLRSLLAQSLDETAYEIVVVDDGSTDRTEAVVRAVSGQAIPAIKYLRQDHSGSSAARNRCAREASGELICYVDDDVEVEPSWLEAVVAGASRNPEASCFAGRVIVRLEGKAPRTCDREYLAASLDEGNEERVVDRAVGANMAIRKQAFKDVGPFNEALWWQWDEYEWQDRLHARGGQIVYLPMARVWHRRVEADLKRGRLLKNRFRWGTCYPIYARETNKLVPVWPEVRHLFISLAHAVRRRCFGGLLMVFFRLGVLSAVARGRLGAGRFP
ncbi:MAG: glycosyltransferase family A protein [Actinomycetota bacterium]